MHTGEKDDESVPMRGPEEDLDPERTKQERSDSPTSSRLSLKSERSIPLPMNFSGEEQRVTVERTKEKRSDSSSRLSLKSDRSIPLPMNFSGKEQRVIVERTKEKRSDSSSLLSLKSDRSIPLPMNFSGEEQKVEERVKKKRSDSPTSLLSLRSERSIPLPMNFSGEKQQILKRSLSFEDTLENVEPRPAKRVCQQHSRDLEYICRVCVGQEHRGHRKTYTAKHSVPDSLSMLCLIMENMRTEDFQTFKRELCEDYPECLGSEPEQLSVSDAAEKIMESFGGEMALRITLHFQGNGNRLKKITDANKAKHKTKCQHINEGNSSQGKQSSLKEIYTDLYMTDGGSVAINNEHEVLRIEAFSRSRTTQELQYACNDIFKTLAGEDKRVRTVLTIGIVGIGKHVSVQKFILDWAEGNANQDIEIIIHLLFRELNQRKGSCSLQELIHQYAPELKGANLCKAKVLFILDGLEVCRYPLDFHNNDPCADVHEKVPVDVLLTNLIKGNLFPSALLWITTRPSTADRIPPEYVHRVTEIHGFSDTQKEEYFRKKINNQVLASKIIAHIKSCRSLYIMCHMPIFCWISATVLENMMSDVNAEETPRTLTEMFTHLLLIQISLKHKKFNGSEAHDPKKLSATDREMILKLGQLAFYHIEKGNLVFQEEDLINAGIDVSKVSEYSLCTEVFREELGLYREKVYSFLHVSVQEYLAAIYAHFTCVNDGKNVLDEDESKDLYDLSDVHQTAVEKTLKSENGHLDLFLRFLLGLSVDRNCTLLKDLLTKSSSGKPQADKTMMVNFIQEKIKQEQSPERIINLFHCLTELNDNSLVKKLQTAMKSGRLLGRELEPEQWSALAYVLMNSGEELEEFDMKKFQTATENQLRLLPVLKICKKARLDCCNLSFESCRIVARAFQSVKSPLRELDLKNNKLDISGVNILMDGLKSPHCQVKKLGLAACNFPSESCTNLASVLKSTNSLLTELDLSYNQMSSDGVKKLCSGLMSQNCKVQILRLKRCGLTKTSCVQLASVLKSNPHLKELELKSNDLRDSGVKQLSTGLADPQCGLERLGLSGCMITVEGCGSLASAFDSGHLKELDLSYNHPGDSGEKLLFSKIEDPNCELEQLNVEKGGECRMKDGLRKYFCHVTVDSNTIHRRLKLSEDNRKISETTVDQKYPDDPDRFKLYPQVMCREALVDRSYFEVVCEGAVSVGVAYKTSDRKQNIMGINNKFPSLFCQDGKLKLRQNNETKRMFPAFFKSKRVGVYVNWEHGSLSYYSIRDGKLHHLHTHHTTFTDKLYTGFFFFPDSSVTLCGMK